MSDYLIMLHYDLRKVRNYFLEIRRTPKKLVGYILFLAWILLIMLPALKNRARQTLNLSQENSGIIIGLVALLLIALIFLLLFNSTEKISYRFSMGDVNLLFPSPLEPRRILFWSSLKKIPLTLLRSILPVLILTPTLLNLGLGRNGILFVYCTVVIFALLLSPLSFLTFLISVRYEKKDWVRGILVCAVIWLAGNWIWPSLKVFTLANLVTGFKAPGVWHFPFCGWIIQLLYAAFYGATPATYLALALALLTLGIVNLFVLRLAKDYYEDVLDYAAKMESIRERKRKGTFNKLEGLPTGRGSRKKIKKIRVFGNYPGGLAFLFKQTVYYRRAGFNEFIGYLTPLSALAGIAVGILTGRSGMGVLPGFLIINGTMAYILLIRGIQSPMGMELSLPYLYFLPGSFKQKTLALSYLPILRFTVNILLFNLGYAFLAGQGEFPWVMALGLTILMGSLYFEQTNIVAFSYLLLPEGLDRRIFYPMLLFVRLLLVFVPPALIGTAVFLLSHSIMITGLGIIIVNFGIGLLLLFLADRIFSHLEMREFSGD